MMNPTHYESIGMAWANKSCKSFPAKLFKVSEENILFSTKKIPGKVYLTFITFSVLLQEVNESCFV